MNRLATRPLTIVTGFLGSGKTTLLRRLLAGRARQGTAVLVNEFGDVGLDHHLVRQVEEQTILLGHGCICCTVRDDLVQALRTLLDQDQRGAIARIDRVVVETTGLADPAPILFTIRTDPMLQHHFRIDRVVVTVDAVNGHRQFDRHAEAWKQAVAADDIIVTKTDMAASDTIASLLLRLRGLNPTARLTTAVFGDVEVDWLLESEDNRRSDIWRAGESQRLERPTTPSVPGKDSSHAADIRSIALTFDEPLDWVAFSIWLSMLLHARGENVLRVKGLLNVDTVGPVVLNGVQHIMHVPEHLQCWPDADQRSHLVFILHAIDPHDIVRSLQAFQHLLGAQPRIDEMHQ
jgi:G3E family GTPase